MAIIIAADIVGFKPNVMFHNPITVYERQVIEANRRMAEEGIVRVDYQNHDDGEQRTRAAAKNLEERGHLVPQS